MSEGVLVLRARIDSGQSTAFGRSTNGAIAASVMQEEKERKEKAEEYSKRQKEVPRCKAFCKQMCFDEVASAVCATLSRQSI